MSSVRLSDIFKTASHQTETSAFYYAETSRSKGVSRFNPSFFCPSTSVFRQFYELDEIEEEIFERRRRIVQLDRFMMDRLLVVVEVLLEQRERNSLESIIIYLQWIDEYEHVRISETESDYHINLSKLYVYNSKGNYCPNHVSKSLCIKKSELDVFFKCLKEASKPYFTH